MKLKNLTDNDVIHCQTQEEATLLCNELHRLGKIWCNGESYLNNSCWNINKKDTCYNIIKNTLDRIDYCKSRNYTIIPFSDIELEYYYGLKIGDKLPKNIISDWSKKENNFHNNKYWCNYFSGFIGDRIIKSFKIIDGVLGFELSDTASIYLKAEGFKEFIESFDTLPTKWYLPLTDCTKQQLIDLNEWRRSVCSELINIQLKNCMVLLSKHEFDGSYYFNNTEDYLLDESFYEDYTKITIDQFYKHILNEKQTNTMKRFHFKLTLGNAKRIINIACDTWKSKLADEWSKNLLLSDYVMITEEFYTEMRKACNDSQNKVLDEIFGVDNQEIDLTKPETFNNLELFIKNALGRESSLIGIRCTGNFKNKSFYLNENYSWELKKDNSNTLCLIPTKK